MAYADTVLGLSPLLYYILDQTGSDNPVESVSGISTALTAPYTWGVTGPISGYTALSLSGGYYTLSRQGMTGNQTRAGWVKTTSTDSTSAYDGDVALPVFADSSGSVWDSFGITNGKVEYRRFNNSTWETFTASTSVNDGNWHHVAMTYNSSTGAVRLFVDGSADGSGTHSAHQNQGGIQAVGRGYDVSDLFDGSLAHLCAWNSILSDADILTLATVPGATTAKSDTDSFSLTTETATITTLTSKSSADSFMAGETQRGAADSYRAASDLFVATEFEFKNYSPTGARAVSFGGHRTYAHIADADDVFDNDTYSRIFRMRDSTEDLDMLLFDPEGNIVDLTGLTVTFDVGTPGISVQGVDGAITTSIANPVLQITIPGGLPPGVYSCRATVNTGTVDSPVYRSYPTEPITLIVEALT